jgi:putative transposase
MEGEEYRVYKHNPPHLFRPNAIYMVTGSTLGTRKPMQSPGRKQFFIKTLFEAAETLDWRLEAWAVLPNHYHFIARAPEAENTLTALVQDVHSITAKSFNQEDGISGRQVWYTHWDSCLQSEKAYWEGLLYVHTNPVRHRMVGQAEEYPFCSYSWFMDRADPGFVQTVLSQQIEGYVLREGIGDIEV